MPIFTQPDGDPDTALQEFNGCHNPTGPGGGQFCGNDVTRVGITSYRTKDKTSPEYRSGHQILGRDLRGFEAALKAIPTVQNVSVHPGTGAYQSGWEPTWIVAYRGNGAARRLLAETGKRYNQESILLMHRSTKPHDQLDPAVELQFPGRVSHPIRQVISDALRAQHIGGWTWGKRGQNTVLRSVSVPAWGGVAAEHLAKMRQVHADLTKMGFVPKWRVKYVETEVLDRDAGDYERVLAGGH